MKLQQLRYFCEVARQGLSVSKAASALHTSQPGDSKQLALLEAELGISLFTRNRNRISEITAAGRALLTVAQRMLDDAETLKRLAQDFVAEWIWLRDAPATETAIERDRYGRYGYTVRDANVRVARLQRMRGDADMHQPLVYSTLEAEIDWIRAVLQRCWA